MVFGVVMSVLGMLLWHGTRENGPVSQRTAYAQEDCTEVATFGPETEDQITDPITISGNTIRLTADLQGLQDGLEPFFTVISTDEEGTFNDTTAFTEEGTQTENFLSGPGAFTFELEAGDTEYTLTVEDCGASPTGGGADQGDNGSADDVQYEDEPTPTPKGDDDLLEAGGPVIGPMPLMPDGSCPKEFPVKSGKACNAG